jgi:hypothetical protein
MHYRRRMTYTHCQDGIAFIQPTNKRKIIRLSGTARRIWEILEYPITTEEIAHVLAAEFSAGEEEIAKEVDTFLESLNKKGLLEITHDMPSSEDRQRFRYLSLLKRALMNLIYPEHELRIRFLEKLTEGVNDLERKRYLRDIRYREPDLFEALIDAKHNFGISAKAPYWFSHTAIGMSALDNLERCAEIVISENIYGDFMEAGVCQGGATIFMRALQVAYDQQKNRLWVADSFQGLPESKSNPDKEAGFDFREPSVPYLAFCQEGVRDNFLRYNLLDEGVNFIAGWFDETLPHAPIEKLAILRVDADLYASTIDVLENLYPKVTPGGFVIVDDYGYFNVCRQAVDEYRQKNGIDEPINFVNKTCIYWRKRAL